VPRPLASCLGRRQTKPGRRLIADHGAELNEAEGIVNVPVAAWRDGDPTPVGPALDAMLIRWLALPVGEEAGRRVVDAAAPEALGSPPECGDATASAAGCAVLIWLNPLVAHGPALHLTWS
jgi:hypothetical protein